MKILILQDRLRSGGTERQSVLLARAFQSAGHPTLLLTFRPGGALSRGLAGFDHASLQSFDLGLDWFAPRLFPRVEAFGPDVILCMGRMANCYGGGLQQRFPKVAVVATLRTGKPLPWLFRRSLNLVRHVIANSQEAKDRLTQRQHLAPDRISVVHNSLVFPEAKAGSASASDLRRQWGTGPTATVLLCVAMFRPEKNQGELIEIAAGFPAGFDWRLWLAGDGQTRTACEELARTLKVQDRVKFIGFLEDPSGLYSCADVAVHASASESLSNFLIEAQAQGVPAVAYEAQGISECSIPGRTGWTIARGDRIAFRAAVERLAGATADERVARSAEARGFARTAFDPRRQVEATLEIFSRLAR